MMLYECGVRYDKKCGEVKIMDLFRYKPNTVSDNG